MSISRLVAATLAATALLPAAPACASTVPPLDLRQGQGSVGLGMLQGTGDVAVADGLTVGATAWMVYPIDIPYQARMAWTLRRDQPYGNLALAGVVGGSVSAYVGNPHVLTGFYWESWPGWVRLRAGLLGGVGYVETRETESGIFPRSAGPYPTLAVISGYSWMIQPAFEIVVPIGAHVELTLLGNALGSLYARW